MSPSATLPSRCVLLTRDYSVKTIAEQEAVKQVTGKLQRAHCLIVQAELDPGVPARQAVLEQEVAVPAADNEKAIITQSQGYHQQRVPGDGADAAPAVDERQDFRIGHVEGKTGAYRYHPDVRPVQAGG